MDSQALNEMLSQDDPPTTQTYIAYISKPGSYQRVLTINAYDLDGAWAYANAAVAGTAWTVVRIILQPVYTGNVEGGDGTAADA